MLWITFQCIFSWSLDYDFRDVFWYTGLLHLNVSKYVSVFSLLFILSLHHLKRIVFKVLAQKMFSILFWAFKNFSSWSIAVKQCYCKRNGLKPPIFISVSAGQESRHGFIGSGTRVFHKAAVRRLLGLGHHLRLVWAPVVLGKSPLPACRWTKSLSSLLPVGRRPSSAMYQMELSVCRFASGRAGWERISRKSANNVS